MINISLFQQKLLFNLCIIIIYSLVIFFFVFFINCGGAVVTWPYVCNYLNIDLIIICCLGTIVLFVLISSYINKYVSIRDSWKFDFSKRDKSTAGVAIFIPCYSESKSVIQATVDSIVYDTSLQSELKLLFIVVDGEVKGKSNLEKTSVYIKRIFGITCEDPIYFEEQDSVLEYYNGVYKNCKFIVLIRTGANKGKKSSFLLCNSLLRESSPSDDVRIDFGSGSGSGNEEVIECIQKFITDLPLEYLCIVDVDTIVKNGSMYQLVNCLQSERVIGVCGETVVSNKYINFLTLAQVFEYWITHCTLKCTESIFGTVLVLSGCLSMYKLKFIWNEQLLLEYSGKGLSETNIQTANLLEIGEDRYLTNLLLRYYPECSTRYTQSAVCSTNVPETFNTFICQRRRWTNSMIFCNFNLLMHLPRYNLIKRYTLTLLLLFQLILTIFFPIIITIAMYYFIISISKGTIVLSILFLFSPSVIAVLLGRLEMVVFSIPFIFYQWLFNIIIPIYSFLNVDDLKWGSTRQLTN